MGLSWAGPRVALAGLVFANVVPLVGVLAFGWGLHSLLVVYWLESGVVGVESVAKILRVDETDSESSQNRPDGEQTSPSPTTAHLLTAGFFTIHYGIFWVVHGVFVLGFPAIFPGITPAAPSVVGTAIVGLVVSHAVSYRVNYIGRGEYRQTDAGDLMTDPYRRVLVLHLTILFGGFVVAWAGAPLGTLAVMVLVKTVLDVRAHLAEHERAQNRAAETTAPE